MSATSREILAWRVLRSLEARGLVARTSWLVGGAAGGSGRLAYRLTPAGYRLAQALSAAVPRRRLTSPGTFLVRHSLATAEVALAFHHCARANPGHTLIAWECDWQAALTVGATALSPDGYLLYAVAERRLHAFVEVDLGTEHTGYFARKIGRYVQAHRGGAWRTRLPVWPLVLIVSESEMRSGLLRRTTETFLAALPDHERLARTTAFAFATLAEAIGPPGPFGAIWEFAGREGRSALAPPSEAAARVASPSAPASRVEEGPSC